MTNSPLDIENIIQKIGIEINEIEVDIDQLKKEFFDMEFLLKTKKASRSIDKIFYMHILLSESSFFKLIKPPIQLKISIMKWMAKSLGYRI